MESSGQNESFRDRLVNLVMSRKYEKQGVKLPPKYWNLPKYKKEYQQQVMVAAKLIKAYDQQAILNVITKETWCWSLFAKRLPELIEVEQQKIIQQKIINEQIKEQASKPISNAAHLPLFRKANNE